MHVVYRTFLWTSPNSILLSKVYVKLTLDLTKPSRKTALKEICKPITKDINRCIILSRGPGVESGGKGKEERMCGTEEREVIGKKIQLRSRYRVNVWFTVV